MTPPRTTIEQDSVLPLADDCSPRPGTKFLSSADQLPVAVHAVAGTFDVIGTDNHEAEASTQF